MTNLLQEYADARAAVIAMNQHNRPIELLEEQERNSIRLQAMDDVIEMRRKLIEDLNNNRGILYETK